MTSDSIWVLFILNSDRLIESSGNYVTNTDTRVYRNIVLKKK